MFLPRCFFQPTRANRETNDRSCETGKSLVILTGYSVRGERIEYRTADLLRPEGGDRRPHSADAAGMVANVRGSRDCSGA